MPRISNGPIARCRVGQANERHSAVSACNGCRKRKSQGMSEPGNSVLLLEPLKAAVYGHGFRVMRSVLDAQHACLAILSANTRLRHQRHMLRQTSGKYDSLEGQHNIPAELIRFLRSRPAPEAADILHRLRAGEDVESLVRYVQSSDLILQLCTAPGPRQRYHLARFVHIPNYLVSPDTLAWPLWSTDVTSIRSRLPGSLAGVQLRLDTSRYMARPTIRYR